jgi:hypothetical protein
MKKTVVGLMIAVLMAAVLAVSATAAVKRVRTVKGTYTGPNSVGVAGNWGGNSDITIKTKSTERYISLTFKDASGQKVGGSISQNVDKGQLADDNVASFCGSLKNARIQGGYPVAVFLTAGTCTSPTTPSVITTGTYVAKLSNMP